MRTNRVLLAATATVLAFALTGCGSDDEGGGKVPTANGGGASKSAGAPGGSGGKDDVAAYVEGQRAYVKCMRDSGVDMPDPDENGVIDFGSDGTALRALKKDPKFRTAGEKCQKLQVALPESIEAANRPKLTPEQIKIKRDYAACMQKNGAADFPDPGPDGYGGDNNSGAPEWDQTSAGAKRATRTCAPIIGAPVNPPAGKG
ncbi:hypothetical protein [Streptomyces solicathayae]|uniref:Lipoprotein n=1 Tax=Streptomyces solicathayae TaxID=3081768 RepID=A0ABZ0LX55_9ACTN|nr:hypothetical protein [Streptomyces sp. HUAS YS2]WOX23895.1 hypothetical protein R2D22_21900 [Streptomyces sp. HUAS YS2]